MTESSRPRAMPDQHKSRSTPRFAGLAPRNATSSRVGASNRPRNTRPEIVLQKLLSSVGIRYRSHPKNVLGHPDVAVRRSRVVIFCDGDFWHGRHWAKRKIKLAQGWNADYWIAKIEGNRRRDRRVTGSLKLLGWRVVRIWESELRKNPQSVVRTIQAAIRRRSNA